MGLGLFTVAETRLMNFAYGVNGEKESKPEDVKIGGSRYLEDMRERRAKR